MSATYKSGVQFIELPRFTRKLPSRLDEESLGALLAALMDRPDWGDLIPKGGGLRKVRFAPEGRGKSGGVRVIYYWRTKTGDIFLFDLFAKNEKENLSDKELADLRKILIP